MIDSGTEIPLFKDRANGKLAKSSYEIDDIRILCQYILISTYRLILEDCERTMFFPQFVELIYLLAVAMGMEKPN